MPKQTISALLLVLLLFVEVSHADSKADAVRKQAEANTVALQKNDFETIAKNTYPVLIEKVGGKDKMVATMKEANENMQAQGVKIVSITVGTPTAIVVSGDKMYSVVPTVMVATTPDEKIVQNSFLLAISTDMGVTWSFLDGSGIDLYNIAQIIPDFPSDFKLPLKEPPHKEPIVKSAP